MWAVKADFLHPPSGPEMFNPDTVVTFHHPLFVCLFLISFCSLNVTVKRFGGFISRLQRYSATTKRREQKAMK